MSAHAETHAALFERALRLGEKAERLEREGTPSESARNRAERAASEVAASLSELRVSLAATHGEDRVRTFNDEVKRRYPALHLQVSGS